MAQNGKNSPENQFLRLRIGSDHGDLYYQAYSSCSWGHQAGGTRRQIIEHILKPKMSNKKNLDTGSTHATCSYFHSRFSFSLHKQLTKEKVHFPWQQYTHQDHIKIKKDYRNCRTPQTSLALSTFPFFIVNRRLKSSYVLDMWPGSNPAHSFKHTNVSF